jgi:hypothetical protein
MINGENTMTLAEHLAALNAEKQAWMDAGPDRWTGFWVEDLAHWAEIGVHTVEDFKRYDLIQMIWEMYKDVTGIRPRHMDFNSMSMEDLQKEANYLGRQMESAIEVDAEWEYESMVYAQEDAEEENVARDEAPLPIDYVACHYQEGWL